MTFLLLVAALAAQTPSPTPAPAPADAAKGAAPVTTTKNPVVTMTTSHGTVQIELFADKAPKSVENFLGYVKSSQYDGTIFHRVIANFMIQGGGFDKAMNKKPTRAPVVNEAGNGLKNDLGTIAMARTSDPDSATCQFFINVKDNASLNRSPGNPGYTVFGKVIAGLEVVKKIEAVATGTKNGMNDVPVQPVTIESIRLQ